MISLRNAARGSAIAKLLRTQAMVIDISVGDPSVSTRSTEEACVLFPL
jgi:hypothetical protein